MRDSWGGSDLQGRVEGGPEVELLELLLHLHLGEEGVLEHVQFVLFGL